MKKVTVFLMITILVLIIIIGDTACMANPEETKSTSSSASIVQSSEISNPTKATESTAFSDKQIVEAVYTDYYGSKLYKYNKEDSVDDAISTMRRAEELHDRFLGGVISEEDAKEKAEAVWTKINSGMFKSIKKTFESEKQPYIEAVFYEDYGVWFARTPISGTTEDGVSFGLTGGFEIVIRKTDGKVLAVGY